MNEIVVMFLWC